MVATSSLIAADLTAKLPAFAAGVLSALTEGIQSGGDSGLFASFLSQSALTEPTLTSNTNSTPASDLTNSTTLSTTVPSSLTNDPTLNSLLKQVNDTLHQLTDLTNKQNSNSSSGKESTSSSAGGSANTENSTGAASGDTGSTETTAASQTTAAPQGSTTPSDGTDTVTTGLNEAEREKILKKLLAELQQMLTYLSQATSTSALPNNPTSYVGGGDIQATLGAESVQAFTDANNGLALTTSNKDTSTDNTNLVPAPDFNQNLMAFVQLLQKQISNLVTASKKGISGSTDIKAALNVVNGKTSSSTTTPPTLSALAGFFESLTTNVSMKDDSLGTANASPSLPTPLPSQSTTDPSAGGSSNAQSDLDHFLSSLDNVFGPSSLSGLSSPAEQKEVLATLDAATPSWDDPTNNNDTNTSLNSSTDPSATQSLNAALTASSDTVKSTNPYSFASQLSATRTSLGSTGLPSVVEQVILQLNRSASSGQSQMTLQLQPADLGRINIKLDIASNGTVQGKIVADNPSTLSLLSKDVGSLERALQEAGLRADSGSLQFSLGGQAGNSFAQTSNYSQQATPNTVPATTGTVLTGAVDPLWTDYDVYTLTPTRVNLKV